MKLSRYRVYGSVCVVGLGLAGAADRADAQTSFKLGEKEVQVHGSIQQGFATSSGNNFLTMDTTDGSAAMTDAALNLSSNMTRRFRVGAQVYVRNIGELGNGQIQLDWAFADYKFHDTFGVRAGKVKTPLGLFNDTQDMEFLHTWALLPQGPYPLDLRSVSIAHVGGDVYGTVRLGKGGSVTYGGYAGLVQDDKNGGYRYGVEDGGINFDNEPESRTYGLDARWATPVDGLMVGYSFGNSSFESRLTIPSVGMTVNLEIPTWRRNAVYGDYQKNGLRLSGEFRHDDQQMEFTPAIQPPASVKSTSWFGSASYRISQWLEVGSYHSRYVADTALPAGNDDNHINDTAITGRFDVNAFWNVKVEGHFMDGYGSPFSAHGFYPRNNRNGFESKTKMLVIRTGVNF